MAASVGEGYRQASFFDETIDGRFREFHAKNPIVYSTLVRLARSAIARGKSKLGIGFLWERMRWELWIETATADEDDFHLNNNFRSRYARLIMEKERDLDGIFETRELKSL